MAETTIEWTRGPNGEQGYTFNPWIGCEKISPACDNCYAAAQDNFRHWTEEGWGGPRRRTSAANWAKPKQWDAAAKAAGTRYRVFCASLADVFDNQVSEDWRDDLWQLIWDTPNLDWLLLTKRVGNVLRFLPEEWTAWPHVAIGATIANRAAMLRDGPKLKDVPARLKFWSCEPLLGDLGEIPLELMPDWGIAGGESGTGARPSHPDWFRRMRDQFIAAGKPWLFKQWGEYSDFEHIGEAWNTLSRRRQEAQEFVNGRAMIRVGKKAAGRLLDGRTWDGFPK